MMDVQKQDHVELEKVAAMIEDIKFAMLTTVEEDGTLRSRPMSTVEMDAEGNLWFFTALSSPKIDEIEQHREVNLSYMRTDKQEYVSISGTSTIVHDKEKMVALWSPWLKPWFPEGLNDPNLALLKVIMNEAEYWNAPGSAVKRIFGLAKAIATGNNSSLGQAHKIHLSH
jgi:general stress protein 26